MAFYGDGSEWQGMGDWWNRFKQEAGQNLGAPQPAGNTYEVDQFIKSGGLQQQQKLAQQEYDADAMLQQRAGELRNEQAQNAALNQQKQQPQVMANRPPIQNPQKPLGGAVAPQNQEAWEKGVVNPGAAPSTPQPQPPGMRTGQTPQRTLFAEGVAQRGGAYSKENGGGPPVRTAAQRANDMQKKLQDRKAQWTPLHT